ncbi:MAG: sulfite exporter TauE/SafE family protein [Myxococcota bacterium]
MIFVFFTGVAAGFGHVLLGPDHVAALAPFSVEAREKAWVVGLRWGVGHALGIITVALLVVTAADSLDLELLEGAGDYLVGIVLVAVGLWGLRHQRRAVDHFSHAAGRGHVHIHASAALSIGTLHGLVGTGATLAVLPAAGMHSFVESGLFLTGFGLGTIACMMGVAWLLGVVAPREERSVAYRRVFVAASLASLLLGMVWIGLALAGVDLDAG